MKTRRLITPPAPFVLRSMKPKNLLQLQYNWFAPGMTQTPVWSYLTAPGSIRKPISMGWKNICRFITREHYASQIEWELW